MIDDHNNPIDYIFLTVTTVFNETTSRREQLASMRSLIELSEKLIGTDQAAIDYQVAIDSLLSLSGAKFAAINTYEEDRYQADGRRTCRPQLPLPLQ